MHPLSGASKMLNSQAAYAALDKEESQRRPKWGLLADVLFLALY